MLRQMLNIGSNLIKNNVHGSLIKNIGFGFAANSVQDQSLEEDWYLYYMMALTFGLLAWAGGLYLEKKHAENNFPLPVRKSTAVIKQLLSHGAGFGLVTAITHYARDVDTSSGKVALLNMSLISPAAIMELNRASLIAPIIPWEKTRFGILIAADYFLASGFKNMMNNGNRDPFTIVSLVLGFFFAAAEAAYGLKKDRGLTLQNFFNRRIFKITAGVNLIFTLLDLIYGDDDKYTIADNVYLTFGSILLFLTLLELRTAGLQRRERDAELLARYSTRSSVRVEEPALQLEEKKENDLVVNGSEQPYVKLEM